TLGDDVTLRATDTAVTPVGTGVNVALNGGVTSGTNKSLTIDAANNVAIGNASGNDNVSGLSTLDVTGATTIASTAITSSGTQRYRSAVTLLQNDLATAKTLTGATLTFDRPVAATTQGGEARAV